tara:strand:- start:4316 stop:4726 length:411 start_codon:yes stop_codon:yes gene_type:complete
MVTEILSGLWIGNLNDAFNEEFYKDNLITITINCTIDQGFLDIPKLNKIRIPLTDRLDPQRDIQLLRNNIDKILNFIHEKIEEENIFIYCYNGLTVSALICALYMIKKGDLSIGNINDILLSKNKNICLDFDLSTF